jgi:phospholipid-binding lipoprotein MlaA
MDDILGLNRRWFCVPLASAALALFAISAPFADATKMPSEPSAMTEDAQTETSDPLEGVNRFTSGVNRVFRDVVVDPLVDGYQYITPTDFQNGISNIFSNLTEPVTAVSSLLQGDTENAGNATKRFLMNSTVGIGGIGDAAKDVGIEQRREDLGQAMAANGVESGPHIVLPILGPSNLRDATGDLIIGLTNPFPLAVQAASGGVEYSNNQDAIQELGKGAVDPYVAEREAYEQNRDFLVTNGQDVETDFPTFASEPAPILATTPAQ